MGYTNYHYQKESFTDDEWEYIQHHKKKIIQHFNYVEIEEDTSDDDTISLNGVGYGAVCNVMPGRFAPTVKNSTFGNW